MSKKFREVSDKEKNRLYVANYDNKLLLEEYFEFVVKRINLEKDVSVVVDPGNGSAYEMLPLYEKIGCEVHGINVYPNGEFPGRGPDPNKKSLRYTSELLKNVKADFAVAFDADADRGIILDNKGRFVPPEKIAVIIARSMNAKGKIVASTDCSILLEKELLDSGIKVVREKVGDVFISRAVKKYNAIIGVERSGHFFIPSFHASDDPFVMSAKLAEILSSTNDNLSELVDQILDYSYYSEYFRCCDDVKFDVMKKIKDKLLEKGHRLDLRDGIRIATDEWMVLIRASHTEPLIRMYIETSRDNLEELKKIYKKEMVKTIRENLGN
jgi:phosphomannomutase